MSRHIIAANNPRFEIVVGYDRPLDDFFGQVYDRGGSGQRLLRSILATIGDARASSWVLVRHLGGAATMLLSRAAGSAEEGQPIEWLPRTKNLVAMRDFVAPFGTLPASVIIELTNERVTRAEYPMTKVVDHRRSRAQKGIDGVPSHGDWPCCATMRPRAARPARRRANPHAGVGCTRRRYHATTLCRRDEWGRK